MMLRVKYSEACKLGARTFVFHEPIGRSQLACGFKLGIGWSVAKQELKGLGFN